MRFNPKAIGTYTEYRCKYCGCPTGPSGVCGYCKIIVKELEKEVK